MVLCGEQKAFIRVEFWRCLPPSGEDVVKNLLHPSRLDVSKHLGLGAFAAADHTGEVGKPP